MKRGFGVAISGIVLSIIVSHNVFAKGAVDLFGTVLHAHGAPAIGYDVYISDNGGQTWLGPAVTDNRGRFAFYGISGERYLLSVSLSGQQVWQGQFALGSGQRVVITLKQ
jgi:hypothetical protein